MSRQNDTFPSTHPTRGLRHQERAQGLPDLVEVPAKRHLHLHHHTMRRLRHWEHVFEWPGRVDVGAKRHLHPPHLHRLSVASQGRA